MRLDELKNAIDTNLGDVKMSEELKQRIRDGAAARQQQEALAAAQKPARRFGWRKLAATAGLAAACLILAFIYLPGGTPGEVVPTTEAQGSTVPPLSAKAMVSVTAQEDKAGGGVATSTAFVINTQGLQLSADQLDQTLEVIPAIDYDIVENGQDEFLLVPTQPLEEGTVYQIALTALSSNMGQDTQGQPPVLTWAFQTESSLEVISCLPANNSTWVPTDSGIEITLSRRVTDAQASFSIQPATQGRLEYHDKTIVFVPTAGLLPDTLYTVTLQAGLTSATGEALAQDYVFSFRTLSDRGDARRTLYLDGPLTESYLPDDAVAIKLLAVGYGGMQDAQIETDIQVYTIPGADEYLRLANEHSQRIHPVVGRSSDYLLPTEGLQLYMSAETTLYYDDINVSGTYAVLPQTPAEGYYLVQITARGDSPETCPTVQKLVCISSVAVWSQSADGQTLVWLNDSQTGQALGQATVTAAVEEVVFQADTDDSGIALIDTSPAGPDIYSLGVVVEGGGQSWAGVLPVVPEAQTPADRLYYSCIYFDRAAYLPTDTVNFWGFVSPRNAGTPLPQDLVLQCAQLPDVPLELDENGIFSGSMSFQNLISYYMSVSVTAGGQALTSSFLQIREYTKPTYVLEVSLDKPYYRKGEQVNATAEATFFDGTPAPGIELNIGVTDQNGKAAVSYTDDTTYPLWGCGPYHGYYDIYTSGQEDGQTYMYAKVLRFPSDYLPEVQHRAVDGGFYMDFSSHTVDYAAIDALVAQGADLDARLYTQAFEDTMRGQAYDQTFQVVIKCTERVVTSSETRYDYLAKETYEYNTYEEIEYVVESFQCTTTGGAYTTPLLPYQSTETQRYYYEVSLTTPDQATASFRQGVYTSWFAYGKASDQPYTLVADSYQFTEGTPVALTLNQAYVPAENQGRLLWSVYQDSLISSDVTGQNTFLVECDESLIPNFTVLAAYFDGRHIYPVAPAYIAYQSDARQLEVDITPQQPSYLPGEEATAIIEVRGADGAPVQAHLVLSVVDEAAFAVAETYEDILRRLYDFRYYPAPATFASYVDHGSGKYDFAEGGGEGVADGVRQRFVDTAAFIPITTDQNGMARVTFGLPDNLTSWRMTCAAVTDDAWAGMGTANLQVSLPFFANIVQNSRYAQGDDIVFSARGAGSDIQGSDLVEYKAVINGPGVDKEITQALPAREYVYFNFGKLPVGQYTVVFQAECGGLKDAVAAEISVVPSLLEVPVTQAVAIDEVSDISSLRFPVTLTLYDKALDYYLTTLSNTVSRFAYSQRADQRLASAMAGRLLAGLYSGGGADTAQPGEDLSGIQQWDGSLALLPYSQGDPQLTAKAIAACPELIDVDAAVEYLYRVIYDRGSPASSVSAAYLGLAAAREPVLLDIRALLENGRGLDLQDKLMLSWGLALLGDASAARAWYGESIAPLLVRLESGEILADTGDSASHAVTSAAAALATAVGSPDARGLAARAGGLDSGEYLPSLDLIYISRATAVSGQSRAAFSYTLDGRQVSVALGPDSPVHTVTMNEAQLAAAGFEVSQGEVGVLASYVAGADSLGLVGHDPGLGITKKYTPVGQNQVKVSITVTIQPPEYQPSQAQLTEAYSVTDVLPSGLRFVAVAADSGNQGWHLSYEDGGRQGFTLLPWRLDSVTGEYVMRTSFTITYYARVALPGQFAVAGAVVRHSDTGLGAVSAADMITVP